MYNYYGSNSFTILYIADLLHVLCIACIGACVVLNIFRWFRRSRCALLVFLVLFFTLSFFKLTSNDYESDRDIPYYVDDPVEEDQAQPKTPVINVASYRLSRPNCNALEDGDESEIRLVEDMLYKETHLGIPNNYFQASTINCSRFRELRNYADAPYSVHELETPLAYVIAVKSSAEQVERLLRAVYVPQNVYCLYSVSPTNVDFETSELGMAIQRIAGCFSNVFLTSNYNQDRKPNASLVAPFRVCLESLLAYPSWRYVLLASEGDFPLRTNREIIDGVKHAVTTWRGKRTNSRSPLLPPLNSDNDFSGYVLTRKMAHFTVRRLEKREGKTNAVEMHAHPENPPNFLELKIRLDNFCPDGKHCALTSSDLHWLLNQPVLFARRFDLTTDYVIIGCLENRLQTMNAQAQEVHQVVLVGGEGVRDAGAKVRAAGAT